MTIGAMRLAAAVLVAAIVGLIGFDTARADVPRRVALVITNGAYAHAGSLKNPVNDGALVASSLRSAGFQIVDADPNLGIGPFRGALRRFHASAAGARVALIYYAGHGIEARGKNWLIPTDATLQQDSDLDYEAIDLDLVLGATDGADMRVVVLDACRNNPFGHSWRSTHRAVGQGLAPIDVDDVLVIYSAGPGQTASDGRGSNSPFAEALAKRLPQPGLPIQLLGGLVRDDVLRATGSQQRPFISASITGEPFMLVPGVSAGPVSQAAAAVGAGAPANDARSMEMMFWQSASAGDDVSQLKAYLSRYPNGSFAELAKAKIATLERPAPGAAAGADRDLRPPAKLDPRSMELAFWNSVEASKDVAQLNAYLDQYPSGMFVRAARAKMAALSQPASVAVKPALNATASPLASSRGSVGGYVGSINEPSRPASPPLTLQPLAATHSGSRNRYGDSDDYVCNHGDPDDPRTVQACKRLRGTP